MQPAQEAADAPLRAHRGYVRLWWARLAGVAASQMQMVAIGWQMYTLTGSAWDLGLVGLVQFVPALLLTLPAGALIDRWHRGRILAATMAISVAVALLLTLASGGGWVSREWLLALSVVLGAVRAFQMPAVQALAPLLVPPALLAKAVAFSSSGLQVAIIAGPAVGGLLYALGAPVVYGVCVLLFALSTLLTALIRYQHAPRAPAAVGSEGVLAGLRFVRRHPVLLGAVTLDLFAVLLGGATALLPIFAKDVLQTGPWGLGLLRAAPAVGALAMSLWLARWPIQRRAGPRLLWAVAVFGLATLVFALSRSMPLSLLALAVTGAADMVSMVVRQTLVQLETPDAMRGRVSAVNSVFIGASNQLGEFESGATAAWLGAVGSVVLGGVGTLLIAAAWARLFPDLARRDRLVSPQAQVSARRPGRG